MAFEVSEIRMVPSISAVEHYRKLLAEVLSRNEKVTLERRSVMPETRERSKEKPPRPPDNRSEKTQDIFCAAEQENCHSRIELGVRRETRMAAGECEMWQEGI